MTRSILLSSILAGSLALTACSGSSATTAADTTANAQGAVTKAPVAPQVKASHVRLVADALGDVPLRAEQRTEIEQLAVAAEARHAADQDLHTQIIDALAAQIEAGKIDRAALQPKIDAAADAMAKGRPADRAALERLHAILTPEQRAQFADALAARFHAAHEGHDKGDHHARMEQLATDLKLTDAQREQIMTLMKGMHDAHKGDHDATEAHEHHANGKAMLEAFKGDTFSMDQVAPARDPKVMANKMADHFVGIAEKVLPILTPEQRTIAAAKLREHMKAGGMMAPIGE